MLRVASEGAACPAGTPTLARSGGVLTVFLQRREAEQGANGAPGRSVRREGEGLRRIAQPGKGSWNSQKTCRC
jgi:hypothetical protein